MLTGTPGPIVTCASMYSSGGTQRSDFSLLPSYKHSRALKHVKSLAVELIVLQTFNCFFALVSVWKLKIDKKKDKDNFYLLRMFTYKFLQLPGEEVFLFDCHISKRPAVARLRLRFDMFDNNTQVKARLSNSDMIFSASP